MKLFKRLILVLVSIFLLLLFFLSYFGLETKKFNNLIQTEANKIN